VSSDNKDYDTISPQAQESHFCTFWSEWVMRFQRYGSAGNHGHAWNNGSLRKSNTPKDLPVTRKRNGTRRIRKQKLTWRCYLFCDLSSPKYQLCRDWKPAQSYRAGPILSDSGLVSEKRLVVFANVAFVERHFLCGS
jgi:hypothetical protein